MMNTEFVWHAVGLAVAWLALARCAVVASTVIVHHFGSHAAGLDDPGDSRFWAEAAGLSAFKPTVQAYTDDHRRHHDPEAFATTAGDPDAQAVARRGLVPGVSEPVLWWRLVWSLVSPVQHAMEAWARLKHTFGPNQPRWRRAVAVGLWGGLAVAAWAGGWLGGLGLGLVAPILYGGGGVGNRTFESPQMALAGAGAWPGAA